MQTNNVIEYSVFKDMGEEQAKMIRDFFPVNVLADVHGLLMMPNIEPHEKNEIGVDWDEEEDGFTQYYWDKNVSQMWTDTEYAPALDKPVWDFEERMVKFKDTFKKVLASLTLLDTKQGNTGVPALIAITTPKQRKALLTFMAMMEQIHAKSYSTIYTTLLTKKEKDEAFAWAHKNKYVQRKSDLIHHYYDNYNEDSIVSKFMVHVASVMLESFLFYSGFFLPLYLAGAEQMMIHSGVIIKKIQDDEKLHGSYIGLLAQELWEEMTEQEKAIAMTEVKLLVNALWKNEMEYTIELYSETGLVEQVIEFLKYNLNHAFENLGFEVPFQGVKINPAVENALSDETTTGDVFSVKLKKYFKAKHRPLSNEDFKKDLPPII